MTLQLYNADCLEQMKSIPDNSIDLIICDLPYGCLSGGGLKTHEGTFYGTNGCAWDVKINLDFFWKQIRRIRKDDHTPCIHFCNTKFGYDLIKSNEKEFRYDMVWSKSTAVGFLSANKKPMSAHEMIYIFSKKGSNYNRIDISGGMPYSREEHKIVSKHYGTTGNKTVINTGTRCVKSVIELNNSNHKSTHPTAKPTNLYQWLIERYSNEGDTVLDPTFGSCNSGKVCQELKRNYIGIEMNKEFFDKAQTTLQQPTASA